MCRTGKSISIFFLFFFGVCFILDLAEFSVGSLCLLLRWSEPTCTELCERTRTVARSNEPEAWSLWNLLQDVPLSYFVFLCYARQESQEVFSSEITWGGRAAFGLKCF